jgi:hypothetical protein
MSEKLLKSSSHMPIERSTELNPHMPKKPVSIRLAQETE